MRPNPPDYVIRASGHPLDRTRYTSLRAGVTAMRAAGLVVVEMRAARTAAGTTREHARAVRRLQFGDVIAWLERDRAFDGRSGARR